MISQKTSTRNLTLLPSKSLTGTEQEIGEIDLEKLGFPTGVTFTIAFNGHAADGGTWGKLYLKHGAESNTVTNVSRHHMQGNLPEFLVESGQAMFKYKKVHIDALEQSNIDVFYTGGQKIIKVFLNHYNSTGKVIMTAIGHYPHREELKKE